MAGKIQGITVEIGGDTTKLQTALKGVNTEISFLQLFRKCIPVTQERKDRSCIRIQSPVFPGEPPIIYLFRSPDITGRADFSCIRIHSAIQQQTPES